MLSKLIQHNIISELVGNNNESTTLQEFIKSNKSLACHFKFSYFKHVNLKSYILKYSLVCKDWLNFISVCLCNKFFYSIPKKQRCTNLNLDFGNTIYQKSNITNLFLNANNIDKDLYEDMKCVDETIAFIQKFDNLERLVISTSCIVLIQSLLQQIPNLKIELFIKYKNVKLFRPLDGGVDLGIFDHSQLEFVHIDTYDINYDSIYDSENTYNHYLVKRRPDSICLGFDNSDNTHFLNSNLFNIHSLQYIAITSDSIDTKDLQHIFNNKIVSFKANVALSIFDTDIDDGILNICDCIPYDGFEELVESNRLDHWKDFCQLLANDKQLKHLHLSSSCSSFRYRSWTLQCGKSLMNYGHKLSEATKIVMSESFSLALSTNTTLQSLTLSCHILTDSFYQTISSENCKSIKQLRLKDVDLQHLKSISTILQNNTTIEYLGIIDMDDHHIDILSTYNMNKINNQTNNNNEEINIEEFIKIKDVAIQLFISALLSNTTLKNLEFYADDFFGHNLCRSITNNNILKNRILDSEVITSNDDDIHYYLIHFK